MTELLELRRLLHKHPDLSHHENGTKEIIENHFTEFKPDETISFGAGGVGFLFRGESKGNLTVFRAELDALPIHETGQVPYSSANPGISHACGHDGHMAILTGFGGYVAKNRPARGSVLILFQAAEERGNGAKQVMAHSEFLRRKPECIFALHNIPGLALHSVTTRDGAFSSASAGMIIQLIGKTSHAAEPEQGINPDKAIAKMIEQVHALNAHYTRLKDKTFATVVHIQLGEEAHGTSPGYAEVRLTLRSATPESMVEFKDFLKKEIVRITQEHKLEWKFEFTEEFPAVINDTGCVGMIRNAAREAGVPFIEMKEAFRWSEDFGYYTESIKGGFFGIGSGINQAALHNPDFNFPDELISTGIKLFNSLYNQLHK
ncbi:MAG: amidohydrolase [Bacteroidales bacterium]|nr:amidohydrolase [Bacteroidales bacterium]